MFTIICINVAVLPMLLLKLCTLLVFKNHCSQTLSLSLSFHSSYSAVIPPQATTYLRKAASKSLPLGPVLLRLSQFLLLLEHLRDGVGRADSGLLHLLQLHGQLPILDLAGGHARQGIGRTLVRAGLVGHVRVGLRRGRRGRDLAVVLLPHLGQAGEGVGPGGPGLVGPDGVVVALLVSVVGGGVLLLLEGDGEAEVAVLLGEGRVVEALGDRDGAEAGGQAGAGLGLAGAPAHGHVVGLALFAHGVLFITCIQVLFNLCFYQSAQEMICCREQRVGTVKE